MSDPAPAAPAGPALRAAGLSHSYGDLPVLRDIDLELPAGGTLAVLGLGPVGQLAGRVALHQGVERVIGVDLVPERLATAARHGMQTLDQDLAGLVRKGIVSYDAALERCHHPEEFNRLAGRVIGPGL